MINITSMFGSIFRKKSLREIMQKKHSKEWKVFLKNLKLRTKKEAGMGLSRYFIHNRYLKCAYNTDRSQDDILLDIDKAFPKCECRWIYDMHQQLFVEIKW